MVQYIQNSLHLESHRYWSCFGEDLFVIYQCKIARDAVNIVCLVFELFKLLQIPCPWCGVHCSEKTRVSVCAKRVTGPFSGNCRQFINYSSHKTKHISQKSSSKVKAKRILKF